MSDESRGRWALVTGASAGIGAAFARRLAKDGHDLILVARRRERLEELERELESRHGIRVEVLPLDLKAPGVAAVLGAFLDERAIEVDLLVNNAGFGTHGPFTEGSLERELEMVDVNCRALVEISHLVAGRMKRRRCGGIIHTSSVAAFTPCPYMSTYAATKSFVLAFSEGIGQELAPFGVTVTALCPGYTATEFLDVQGFSGSRSLLAMETAEQVVERGLAGYRRGRSLVVSGLHNQALVFLLRFVPRSLAALIASWILRPAP